MAEIPHRCQNCKAHISGFADPNNQEGELYNTSQEGIEALRIYSFLFIDRCSALGQNIKFEDLDQECLDEEAYQTWLQYK